MSLSYDEIINSPVKQKFYSELLDKIMTRSEILKIIRWDWNRISDEDNFNQFMLDSKRNMIRTDMFGKIRELTNNEKKGIIPFDLEILKSKPFKRWDKIQGRMRLHKGECELSESHSCICWCSHEFHGLRYQRLPNEKII